MIDLHTLQAEKLYTPGMTCDRIDALLSAAIARRGWLIFYTHDVSPQPSTMGCTPELLDYALQAAARAEVDVVTVGQAVRQIAKT